MHNPSTRAEKIESGKMFKLPLVRILCKYSFKIGAKLVKFAKNCSITERIAPQGRSKKYFEEHRPLTLISSVYYTGIHYDNMYHNLNTIVQKADSEMLQKHQAHPASAPMFNEKKVLTCHPCSFLWAKVSSLSKHPVPSSLQIALCRYICLQTSSSKLYMITYFSTVFS